MTRLAAAISVLAGALAGGCAGTTEDTEVTCGEPASYLWRLTDIEALDGCTRFLGSIHVSDTALVDFQSLPALRTIDGSFTFFRNDAATSMHGLEALEVVGGDFGLNNHARLADLDALSNLRVVGGDFYAYSNRSLHDDDARALADRIEIGGTIDISENAPR